MEKYQKKRDIMTMSVAASMALKCWNMGGIIGPSVYLDCRQYGPCIYKPGLHMRPSAFLEYFGDDTNYEYITVSDQVWMITEVNGVVFYAMLGAERIREGRIV